MLDTPFEQLEAMLAERRFDDLVELLREPSFRRQAEADEDTGIAALRAIGALAWRTPEAAQLLAAYATLPHDRLRARVELEVELASRWRRAFGGTAFHAGPLRPAHVEEFPDALLSFVADTLLQSPRRRAQVLADLARLLDDPRRLLRACDRIALADRKLAYLLVARIHSETPLGARALDRIPTELFDALGHGLVELERSMRAPLRPWMIAVGAVGGVAAAMTAVGPLALGAGVALGSAGLGSLRVGLARRRYLARVRPGLALLIARLGIQSDNVRAWLGYNRRLAGDLATYDIAVHGDGGLAMLGAIATLVRDLQRKSLGAGA